MHVGQIFKADIANGIGVRVSIFVSGCTNCCKNCFQPETWDFHYGHEFTKEVEDDLIEELSQAYYDGLSILGGEPFEPENQRELVKLIRRVKAECPGKTIWMYSGNTYEEMLPGGRRHTEVTDEILDSIDILVDGRFEEELKDISLNFRGSSNQRIIDMKKTRATGQVVLDPLNE
ncbi:MAG: anaerobic ribonucleoside-triphosphate reductase activating protein [Lachnospiraceae bacterium]|nr:anaerobic ribonucleoside-triphosphate reductase activating protein [Lachnospiraceae bacterium]MBQ5484946.1 anaerobic ribonucleoside-triphosphate reductase activating protein [Lachnospiraceae bacterium]MCR4731958.1 anaerobic ribonucleoside-triphosphate reductase activating protein [Lachnospiraceae bacterium]MEE3355032.1 anaerobic ribonucleoside-triphosphate reductase activating protein [Candidatus Weimeria sp.]